VQPFRLPELPLCLALPAESVLNLLVAGPLDSKVISPFASERSKEGGPSSPVLKAE
jgi:hypothetical protein